MPYKLLRLHLAGLMKAGQMAVVAAYINDKRQPDELAAQVAVLTEKTQLRGATRQQMITYAAAWYTVLEKLLPLLTQYEQLAVHTQMLMLQCGWVKEVRDKARELAQVQTQ